MLQLPPCSATNRQPQQPNAPHRQDARRQAGTEDADMLDSDAIGLFEQGGGSNATVDELQAIFNDLFEGHPSPIDIDQFCNEVIEKENATGAVSDYHSPTLQGQGVVAFGAPGSEGDDTTTESFTGESDGMNQWASPLYDSQHSPQLVHDPFTGIEAVLQADPNLYSPPSNGGDWPLSNFTSDDSYHGEQEVGAEESFHDCIDFSFDSEFLCPANI